MVGGVTLAQPVLLVVRNIKSIKPQVLNELIHLVSNARADRGYNFNLILGVQSNCREELHLRVHIQNCVKLTIKTFYFPSMKNIIFETISNLLLSRENILTFEPQVIQILIQNITSFILIDITFITNFDQPSFREKSLRCTQNGSEAEISSPEQSPPNSAQSPSDPSDKDFAGVPRCGDL